jgi:hypothetical protein
MREPLHRSRFGRPGAPLRQLVAEPAVPAVRLSKVGMMHAGGAVLCTCLLLGLMACGQADPGVARIDDPTADPPREVAIADWYRGAPREVSPIRGVPVAVAWLADDSAIQVTVWGSGSCPPVGKRAVLSGDNASVTMILRSYDGVCTDDLAPATSVVTLPENLPPGDVRHVVVEGNKHRSCLPPAPPAAARRILSAPRPLRHRSKVPICGVPRVIPEWLAAARPMFVERIPKRTPVDVGSDVVERGSAQDGPGGGICACAR